VIDRRAFLTTMLTSATAATLGLPGLARAEDVLELTVALGVDDANFNPTTASVFRLAKDFGFYKKYGVKVTFVALDGTPQAVAALQSGSVDVADISLDAAARLRAANNVPLKGFVAVATGSPFLIAARSDIKTLQDLAGRSFAIADNGSLDHALTQAVLRSYGIDPAAPNFVAIGAPNVRVQALASGKVDATTVSFGTYASIDGTPDVHVLLPADDFSARAPALAKFVATREETIAAKGEALQRFTNALIDAARELEAHPDRWVEAAVAARPDLTRPKLELTSKFIASRWCVNGCMNPKKPDDSVAFVYANPDFKDVPVIPSADLVDLSFTANAIKTLGAAGGTGLDAQP
jgi:NitT/TauT family transport system substrate-binding protein